jgi:hypothetical protein
VRCMTIEQRSTCVRLTHAKCAHQPSIGIATM